MQHDDPKLIVAFDPVKLLAPTVVGLLLADVLLGFVLSMQLKVVLAHPWQSIGYTALIVVLYAILMVLNVGAICAVAIGVLSTAFRLMRFVFRVWVSLLKRPLQLAMNTFRVIAATARMHRKRIP